MAPPDTDRELASLKREFQELREQQKELRTTVNDLGRDRETFTDTIAQHTPVSRRQVNALVATLGITGAVSYLASEGVLAAGETWGSATGTIGTDSEPIATSNIQDADIQNLEVTDKVTSSISNDPSSPTRFYELSGTDFDGRLVSADRTISGDNTAVTVMNLLNSHLPNGLIIVMSRQQGVADGFTDIISAARNNTFDEIQNTTRGTVTRSYSLSSGELQLAIDDTGNTYDVGITGIGGHNV